MNVGAFGTKLFEVNPKTISTPNGIGLDESLNIEMQETEGGKPATYIKGFNEMNVSFDIILLHPYVNVQAEIDWWLHKLRSKKPEYLTLGNKTYGTNKMLLNSVSASNITIAGNGVNVKAVISLSFCEWTKQGYKKDDENSKTKKTEISSSGNSVIDKAVEWAVNIANDSKHGYDQNNRWGPNYDCSAFVITAYENAGVPVKSKGGATYTGDMRNAFRNTGFSDVTSSVTLSNGKGLKTGDVLLKSGSHTALYIGNGKIVHASINENGKITGGKSGDQTGKEICVRSYYNKPWDCVLRYSK